MLPRLFRVVMTATWVNPAKEHLNPCRQVWMERDYEVVPDGTSRWACNVA